MRRRLAAWFAILGIFPPLLGAQAPSARTWPPFPGIHSDNVIPVGGVPRTYDFFVPRHLGRKPVPLVLLLHGHGGDADVMTGLAGNAAPFRIWMDIAEREGFLVVFPEGVISPDGKSGWNDCRGDTLTNPHSKDVLFLRKLILRFTRSFHVDPGRVYASGVSNGGQMVLRLAIELSDRIRAVAAVVAPMPQVNACSPPVRPVSVLFMNGTADPFIPWNGGPVAGLGTGQGSRGTVLSTPDSVAWWVQFDQTDPIPSVQDLPDLDTQDGSTVRRHTYSNGQNGTRVVLYEIIGGGHIEPSIQEKYSAWWQNIVGPQNHDLEMAEAVWAFFQGL